MKRKGQLILAADLFCGAGGTSSGLVEAINALGYGLDLLAVNHWSVAIDTHSTNHKQARHLCQSLDTIDPQKAVPSGRLHLLVASPECTHHSNARGGRPMSDQSRASAWLILNWLEKLYVENVLIENVKEFRDWGALGADGRPLKSRRGELYQQFLQNLRSLGYRVEDRILNAADYGDATTRERLFVLARRGNKSISWPQQTHSKKQTKLEDGRVLKKWRSARQIIDWTLEGESIFGRKKPLSPNTLRRIFAGLFKYSLKPFVLPNEGFYRGNAPRDINEPIPTCTSRGAGYVVEPYLVNMKGKSNARDIDSPLFTQTGQQHQYVAEPFVFNLAHTKCEDGQMCHQLERPLTTITGKGMYGLIEPFLIQFFGERAGQLPRTRSVDDPAWTVTAQGRMGVVEPFIVPCNHGKDDTRSHSVDNPMPTITQVDAWALLQPYLIKYFTGSDAASVDNPLPTVTANYEHLGVCQPYLVEYHGSHNGKDDGDRRTRSIDEPLGTQDTSNRYAVAMPYLVKFYGTGGAASVDEPLDTVTGKDRFGLVIPQIGAILDIRFRMLQPHELAAAMSFPKTYHFTGTRDQKVRQIGNAVPVKLAEALCRSLLVKNPTKKRAAA